MNSSIPDPSFSATPVAAVLLPILERGTWKSRIRTTERLVVCVLCAIVPIGTSPSSRANITFETPLKYCGTSRLKVTTTSRCQSRQKRRRTPKSKNSNGWRRRGSAANAFRRSTFAASRRRPSEYAAVWSKRRKSA